MSSPFPHPKRDPVRIYKFCNEFAALWATVPDLRFGQLISVIFSSKDLFYVEEDKMMEILKQKFELIQKGYVPDRKKLNEE